MVNTVEENRPGKKDEEGYTGGQGEVCYFTGVSGTAALRSSRNVPYGYMWEELCGEGPASALSLRGTAPLFPCGRSSEGPVWRTVCRSLKRDHRGQLELWSSCLHTSLLPLGRQEASGRSKKTRSGNNSNVQTCHLGKMTQEGWNLCMTDTFFSVTVRLWQAWEAMH